MSATTSRRLLTLFCVSCSLKRGCAWNKLGRVMVRWDYQDAVDWFGARLRVLREKRSCTVERDCGASLWNHEAGFRSGLCALEGFAEG